MKKQFTMMNMMEMYMCGMCMYSAALSSEQFSHHVAERSAQ